MKKYKVNINCVISTDEIDENELTINLEELLESELPCHFDDLRISNLDVCVDEFE